MSAETTTRWTEQQREAIRTIDRSLLVSAAAGSGKTAVLAERCAYLVCDAKPACDVDRLLVVTFTEAAAAEMKSRIAQALHQRLSAGESRRLSEQLALIDRAQISTLHGFCARVLRQHFHLVDIDPHFVVMDDAEATLLRSEVAAELFHERYEADESGEFQRFIDAYGDGYDAPLMRKVVATHELLCSLIDPRTWLAEARRRLREPAEGPLHDSALWRELSEVIVLRLRGLRRQCEQACESLRRLGPYDRYVQHVCELAEMLEQWEQAVAAGGADALAGAVNEIPRLPSMPRDTPNKDLATALVNAVKDPMKKGFLAEVLQFTADQWQEGLAGTIAHAEVFLGLVEQFGRRYEQAKRATRSVDFSDLERYALAILRDPDAGNLQRSGVARMYQQRFEHVLVDEYQDINEVQDAILNLVSRDENAGAASSRKPGAGSTALGNMFCVGDVKQSIYRFRLAEPGRFLDRERRFRSSAGSGGRVIDLQKNFRTRGPLIDVLNGIFRLLMTMESAEIEYDDTHALVPGLEYPSADGQACFTGAPVELHLLPAKMRGEQPAADDEEKTDEDRESDSAAMELERAEVEATLIARRIRQLMGLEGQPRMHVIERSPQGLRPRPIRWGDIAILLRSLRYKADQYAEVLRQHGIPVHSAGGSGFFDSVEIRDMLALLELLDNQRQDIPLAAVLRSPLVQLDDAENALAEIVLAFSDAAAVPFHVAAMRFATEKDDDLAKRLSLFFKHLTEWRRLAHQRPVAELIWRIYDDTGYLAFCSGLTNGEQRVANLIHLHERARQFGTFQRQGLGRFLAFIRSLVDEVDLGRPSVASEADDAVRIMSVHRSKGLEFPVVILPDLGKRINLEDTRGHILVDRHAYLGLSAVDQHRRIRYPSLALMLVRERLRRQSLAEELRVLYVATTRAREHLILVGTCRDGVADEWSSRWQGHAGPLPAEQVLAGGCMLDWLGPASAVMSASGAFDLNLYDAQDVASWPQPQELRSRLSETQKRMIALQPLNEAPRTPEAEAVIERLMFEYPLQSLTNVPAGLSVTAGLKQRPLDVDEEDRRGGLTPPAGGNGGASPTLHPPRCVVNDPKPSALDVGTATHLVLQHLDFARADSRDDVLEQVRLLARRQIISTQQSGMVDVDAILWLMRSNVGRLLREHHRLLRREVAFNYALGSDFFGTPGRDEMDQVMIRGRIDVLIPLPQGLIVIDYKTDNIGPEQVAQRLDLYRPQMELYCRAIQTIARRPIVSSHLVFLTPRVIAELEIGNRKSAV